MNKDHHKIANVYKKMDAIGHKTVDQLGREIVEIADDEQMLEADVQDTGTGVIYMANPLLGVLRSNSVGYH